MVVLKPTPHSSLLPLLVGWSGGGVCCRMCFGLYDPYNDSFFSYSGARGDLVVGWIHGEIRVANIYISS